MPARCPPSVALPLPVQTAFQTALFACCISGSASKRARAAVFRPSAAPELAPVTRTICCNSCYLAFARMSPRVCNTRTSSQDCVARIQKSMLFRQLSSAYTGGTPQEAQLCALPVVQITLLAARAGCMKSCVFGRIRKPGSLVLRCSGAFGRMFQYLCLCP